MHTNSQSSRNDVNHLLSPLRRADNRGLSGTFTRGNASQVQLYNSKQRSAREVQLEYRTSLGDGAAAGVPNYRKSIISLIKRGKKVTASLEERDSLEEVPRNGTTL